MTSNTAFLISRILLALVPIVLIAWDVFAYANFGNSVTISHAMWTWSREWRPFSLIIMLTGVLLMWHFFVP